MTDSNDKWFTLAKAGLFFRNDPLTGGSICYSTVRSWADRGVVSKRTGKRVFLRTKQVGGRRKTCMEYYEKFIRDASGEPDEEKKDEPPQC